MTLNSYTCHRIGYRDCIKTFLSNQVRLIKREFECNRALRHFESCLRRLKSTAVNSGNCIAMRSSFLDVPDGDWVQRYEEMFDCSLGYLEVFRPAASRLDEFKNLEAQTRRLGNVLWLAHSLQEEI